MPDSKTRVAIVGGGIAGLVTATLLHRGGIEVRLFEQSPAFGAVGAGIQLSPNGVRVLHRLGLAHALTAQAVPARAIETLRWDDGTRIARVPHGADCGQRHGAPYYLMHRADLQRCLLSVAPLESVGLGLGCTGVTERADGAEVHLTDGSVVLADLVVGADGVHSAVRRAVVEDRPRFSGYAVHRGLVPAALVDTFRDDPRVLFWLGPRRHVTYYPIESGDTVHFSAVGATDRAPLAASTDGAVEDLDTAFAGWHEQVRHVITSARSVTRWDLYDRDVAPRYATDRVVLLGDAAHPTLPYLSQGANQALEDAAVLARCLTAHHPADWARALRHYEALRLPRTAEVHRRARALGDTFHLSDGPAQSARDRAMGADGDLAHLDWLYGYDAEAAGPRTPGPAPAAPSALAAPGLTPRP
ncbi:FAD-dependent monooxygenase [Streptomyces sp. NPDC059070]|uniref:FAD-dependent monooxygenase n=1 Tax=Streptomyces sp. NPDC059070 TaxID=3346713 RepID=UPI0036CBEF41